MIEVQKWKDTGIFQNDVRQVFDFIWISEDKNERRRLVEKDSYYGEMKEDAFDVAAHYANAKELVQVKDYHRKDGKIDICAAIKELIADRRAEGTILEREKIITKMIGYGMADEDIRLYTECEQETIYEIQINSSIKNEFENNK